MDTDELTLLATGKESEKGEQRLGSREENHIHLHKNSDNKEHRILNRWSVLNLE